MEEPVLAGRKKSKPFAWGYWGIRLLVSSVLCALSSWAASAGGLELASRLLNGGAVATGVFGLVFCLSPSPGGPSDLDPAIQTARLFQQIEGQEWNAPGGDMAGGIGNTFDVGGADMNAGGTGGDGAGG